MRMDYTKIVLNVAIWKDKLNFIVVKQNFKNTKGFKLHLCRKNCGKGPNNNFVKYIVIYMQAANIHKSINFIIYTLNALYCPI